MRIKNEYVLREIANTWVVLPIGQTAVNFNGMLSLNESGKMIWQQLEKGASEQQLVEALMQEYEVSAEKAKHDVVVFIENIRKIGCIEDD